LTTSTDDSSQTDLAVDRGRSLSLSWYRDPDLYERESRTVFTSAWQYAGSFDRLSQPGSFFTCWIARIPVVVVRDAADRVRAFANVCPHRGHAVADGDGCRTTLQCPYHGWTYNLDGRLRKAPRTELDSTFDPSEIRLRELAVDRWGPLIFVSPGPGVGFDEATAGLRAAAQRRGLDLTAHPRRASREWELACNWKVALDNNTECYHCATIHRSFASDYYVDREHYLVQGFDFAFTHESAMKRSDNTGAAPDYHLYYLWPNFMISARRDEFFYTYHYRPVAPRRTVQHNDYFFPAEWSDAEVEKKIEEIGVIMREDWDAFESVQRGIDSEIFDHGVVLPQEEALLCHFQKLHARMLEQ
jgi:phenylpropionate dioxygenase-like ring-hydroxylating dioxygenase large terminal subunit